MMKLNNAPCGVTQTVSIFKGNVTCNDGEDSVKGGILKGTKYAWLCQGPFLKIIDVSSGEKIAGWRFGAACLDFVSDVSCAVELPHNDDACNLKQIILGLECEVSGGMICIFDVQGSRLLRAIRIPGKPLSLSIVDSGSSGCEGCYPLPGLLSSMCGIIAVGLQGGSVFLVDLCRLSCDELLNTWFNDDRDKVHDEFSPCQLLPINKDDDDSDKLEKKCAAAAVSGDHLCLLLNEGAFVEDNFLLLEPDGDVCVCHKTRNIGVTSLLYMPRIASLIVGFSFGCFQIWNLMHLTLNYTSRMMKDPLPVMHLGFQEPSDDPCNFCYVWAIHSTTDEFPSSSPPVGIMYALSYESKEWVDGYGYLYQDYQSCHFRFEYNLEVDSSEDVDSICCVAFNTLSNVAIQKNMPEDGFDEVAAENDFSLCIFAWEAYDSENKPISTYLSLFDLNQWYKDQMPTRVTVAEDENLGYLVTFNLNCIRQNGEEPSPLVDTPLLDVRVDPQNLSQFKSFQPQEEHYHPSALSFVSYCLLEDRIASISHPGLQRYLLLYMEKEGPICLLRPVNLFKHCVMVGLKPILMDVNGSTEVPAITQREFLLSIALENQMLGFLHRCASDWANGSVSGVECSLPMLLNWGYQRAAMLKETADGLCVHLFDHTGVRLDKNECRLLDNCATQLRQLATLFEGILNDCRLLGLLNLEDFKQKTSELNLAALYFEVLLWFLNVGLLPEFPENDFDVEPSDLCNTSIDKIPYPATTLTNFYTERRLEFKSLNLKNGTKACLYIDQLLQNENNGLELANLWQSDGGSGMYPPPSIQTLLAMYLLDGIDIQTKNSIVIYVFLDLATLLDPERYSRTIEYFVKFPCAFCMTPSIIKVTQAFWLLDQKHFEDALDMVLDPLVSPKDLQPWQHRFIVHALLSQGQHIKALEYFTVRQLPIQGIEDIQLKISLLVMNKQVTQAYNFLHQYHNEENSKELLYHFYQECGKVQQLGTVLKLMLSPVEEELLMNFLQNCNISQSEDMQVVFYLMRSRVIEAVAVNQRINNSGIRKSSFRRTRNDPTVRDVLVGGYGKTLPSVTRQLANYCSQQKRLLSNWRQVQRPTPMSVDVNYGTKQPVSYKSSLIHATLEKARETWMMPLHSSFNSEVRNKELMDVSAMQNLPFLCTSHDNFRHDRETTPVVFPSVTSASKRRLDDDGASHSSTPVKRSRLENSPSVESFLLLNNKKNTVDLPVNNSPLLLKSPLIKRIAPLKQLNDRSTQEKNGSKPFAETFTPQSILKVRNLVRRSKSPEQSQGYADDLLHREQSRTRQSEERLCARQIRFSLPVTNDLEEHQPLSSSTPAQSFNRGKSPNRISARLPLRSSLSLLSKPLVEINREMSSNLSYRKSWFPSTSIKEICENVSELNSEKYIEKGVDIMAEDGKSKLNDSFGEESFYSATSSSDSGTSKDSSKIDSAADEASPSYNREKYIHNIKEIKPRRQLSRLKPELQSKSVICEESVISIKVNEKKYASSVVNRYEKRQTLDNIDIKNFHKNDVNQQPHRPEHDVKESDEDCHNKSNDSEEDGVRNHAFKKNLLGNTLTETLKSYSESKEDNDPLVENDVCDLNSELSHRREHKKGSDDSKSYNVRNSCTFQKSILSNTFIENSGLYMDTSQNRDESKKEKDAPLDSDYRNMKNDLSYNVQDLNSELPSRREDKKESDDDDDDDGLSDNVVNSCSFRKSILGDTFIEGSCTVMESTEKHDESTEEIDSSFENDSQDFSSEAASKNESEKANDFNDNDRNYDSMDNSVINPSMFKKSILGDTFIDNSLLFMNTSQSRVESKKEKDAPLDSDYQNMKNELSFNIQDLNSELCSRREDDKGSDGNDSDDDDDDNDGVSDNVMNSYPIRKSILGDTFIEGDRTVMETTKKHDESTEESDSSFENDIQDSSSVAANKNESGKGNDFNDTDENDDSMDNSVINPSMFQKSILGDTLIDNSRLFMNSSLSRDESKREKVDSFGKDTQVRKSELSHQCGEGSFVRIQQIKARRPLSRISKSGSLVSNVDSSLCQMDKSYNWETKSYEKESVVKDVTGVDIEVIFHEGTKETLNTEGKYDKLQDDNDDSSSNVQGITNEYETVEDDAVEVVKVVEVHSDNLSFNIQSESKESQSLFSTNHSIWKENLFQTEENVIVSSDSQNFVQNVKFQENKNLSFKESENNEEFIMDDKKTYASLTVVSSEQSDYAHLLPSQTEVCKKMAGNVGVKLEDERNVFDSNVITDKMYPSVASSTNITRSFLESSYTYVSNEEICDDDNIIIDSPIQSYEVLPHYKTPESNESPVEQVSSSTGGETSGTIELDSDESDEKNTAESSLKKEQTVSMKDEVESRLKDSKQEVKKESLFITSNKKDLTVESSEIVVIDSDTECSNKITLNEQNQECVENKNNLYKESFGEKQQDKSEKGRMNPDESTCRSFLNESVPLVLKLSDSENETESPSEIEESRNYTKMVEVSSDTESSPTLINVNMENKGAIACSIYSSNEMENSSGKKFESCKEHQGEVETSCKNVVAIKNKEVDQNRELEENKQSEPLTEILPRGSSVCHETEYVANPVHQQNSFNVVVANEQQSVSRIELSSRSGAGSESTATNVIAPEDQEFEQSNSKVCDVHYSLRSFQNVQCNTDKSENEYQTRYQGEVKQECSRPKKRTETEPRAENEDGIATMGEISTSRARQRSRPSSVQSEPYQMSDVLGAGNHSIDKKVATPQGHGALLRRRRISLQTETEPNSDGENVLENQDRSAVGEISTPRTRQRGRPSSIHSEPPQMSDVLGAENQLIDEKSGTPKAFSSEVSRLRRRRSSLQIEPLQPSDEKRNEGIEEIISGEISTPKSRLRVTRRSIQSVPADSTDVLAKEIEDKDGRTEISLEQSNQFVKARRRSSLNIDSITTGDGESLSGNKKRIEIVGEIGTQQSRQRGRPSSVQSEPPQMSDVMTESQTPDRNIQIVGGQSSERIRLRRRRSSLQFEPIQMDDITASETNKEIKDELVVKELKDNKTEHFSEGRRQQTSYLQSEKEENDAVIDSKVNESRTLRTRHGNRSNTVRQKPCKVVDVSKESKTVGDASESTDISDNISKSLPSPKKEPQLGKVFVPHKSRLKMNLRSQRAFSEGRELPITKDKKVGSTETFSDSDDYSIQSEPPQLRDVSEVRQLRSLKSRKVPLKKKKNKKSMYMLKISPPKLPCVKEEPENEGIIGDGEKTQPSKESENEASLIVGSTRALRSRKRVDSVSSQTSSVGEGRVLRSMHVDEQDSPSSMSSKSTLILDHSNKRKRDSSPSCSEEQEAKKFLKDEENIRTLKSDADGSKEKSVKISNSDHTIEQYATARRLTRYQKNVMERSIDTTKGVHHEFQQSRYHSDKTAEDSDGESEASGYTSGSSRIRASARLQEKRSMTNDRSPSQSSSVSVGGDRTPKKQIIRHRSPVRTSPGERSENSPASVRSGKSTSNASSLSSSQWQWRSPNSEITHSSSKPRRKSFQKAQMALYSPAKKHTSPKTSEGATTDTSEGDTDDKITGRKPLKKEYETASEAGSEWSQSSAVSSTLSRNTRSSAKNTVFSSPSTSQAGTKDDRPSRRDTRQYKNTSESHSSAEDSPQKDSKLQKKPTRSKDIDGVPAESQNPERKSQNPDRKYYPVFRRRKYFKLHSNRKTT